ncbi:bZIP transcription factor 11 [Cajanus cajan]|uniref:Ocs element-binding factor 1 n=1 Tax=Cajanus cajan TaxID=3821 RepID=A0A151TKV4_CAJCA|nr:bZIP transcription factor 11 [Cajanus cajan]KYP67670.1 Ocs element-binding factor 1 [Cajanus cajan]
MASPGGSSWLQNSGSEGSTVEERKRKRMVSNRESARRSRMRKQQHLEGLSVEVDRLKKEKEQMSGNISMTMRMLQNVEAENAILRAQMAELTNSLNSLNEIIDFINSTNSLMLENDCGFVEPWNWNSLPFNQPIVASAADVFMF